MKPFFLSIFAITSLAGAVYAADPATPPIHALAPEAKPVEKTDFSKIFKSDTEKNSYAIGMSWASPLKSRLKGSDMPLDHDAIARGFRDTLDDTNIITEAQMKEIIGEVNAIMRAKMQEKQKEEMEKRRILGEKNKSEGEAFLAKNKTAPGVITLPSGLQYQVISEGTGAIPKTNELVTVNYRGTLIDGMEFDSSAKAGKPLATAVRNGQGGVINGWVEALQLMKTGSKWKLFIPSTLAYGPGGYPPAIGPNAALIFDIELLTVQAAPPTPPTPPSIGAPGVPLTSDIIKVPSAEGLKKGEKIETIKAEDLEKERAKETAKDKEPKQ